jgi:hypothetical protein
VQKKKQTEGLYVQNGFLLAEKTKPRPRKCGFSLAAGKNKAKAAEADFHLRPKKQSQGRQEGGFPPVAEIVQDRRPFTQRDGNGRTVRLSPGALRPRDALSPKGACFIFVTIELSGAIVPT